MADFIKKTMLTGLGLVVLTKSKIEELVKELAEKGKMSEKEGKEMLSDLLKKSEEAGKEFQGKVENIVKKVLEK